MKGDGWYRVEGNKYKKGKAEAVPLYEGKMVQMYDHRAASVVVNPDNLHRPAQQEAATLAQHQDPKWLPEPQFWVERKEMSGYPDIGWALTYKEITEPTNVRTSIALIAPFVAFGNKVPLLLPEDDNTIDRYKQFAPLLTANMNSFVFDFVARQKLHGQTINLFILEQLPVLRDENYKRHFGNQHKIADFIREQVLCLTYTATDMEPFARDMGYAGAPFVWDEEERRHRMARLDALYFCLYRIKPENAAYILDTFPIVREHDEKQFGRYRTKELILAYMNAVAAGDFESVVEG